MVIRVKLQSGNVALVNVYHAPGTPTVMNMNGLEQDGTTSNVTHPHRHHEQTKSVQKKFVHDVRSLLTTTEEMENPFMEESMDLMYLNSKAVMPEKVVKDLKNL